MTVKIVPVTRARTNTSHEHEPRKLRASPLTFFEQPQSGVFSNLQELKMLAASKQAKTMRGLDQGVHSQDEAFLLIFQV